MRRSRAQWQQLVDEALSTSVVAVAKRHGVKARTLSWWKWRLRSNRAKRRSSTPRLVRVMTTEALTVTTPQYVELSVDGVGIRVDVRCSVEYLAQLVRALRAC